MNILNYIFNFNFKEKEKQKQVEKEESILRDNVENIINILLERKINDLNKRTKIKINSKVVNIYSLKEDELSKFIIEYIIYHLLHEYLETYNKKPSIDNNMTAYQKPKISPVLYIDFNQSLSYLFIDNIINNINPILLKEINKNEKEASFKKTILENIHYFQVGSKSSVIEFLLYEIHNHILQYNIKNVIFDKFSYYELLFMKSDISPNLNMHKTNKQDENFNKTKVRTEELHEKNEVFLKKTQINKEISRFLISFISEFIPFCKKNDVTVVFLKGIGKTFNFDFDNNQQKRDFYEEITSPFDFYVNLKVHLRKKISEYEIKSNCYIPFNKIEKRKYYVKVVSDKDEGVFSDEDEVDMDDFFIGNDN